MADEPAKAASEDAAGGAPKSKKSIVMGGIIAGVMLVEGVGLYVGMKLFGSGPQDAPASEGLVKTDGQSDRLEIPIVKIRVPNRMSGKTYLYDIEVAATLVIPEGRDPHEYKKEILEKIEKHESGIRDRISYLIRSAELQQLDEPGLVMIRRQIKDELGKVLCDEKLFDEILLPRWTPLRADM